MNRTLSRKRQDGKTLAYCRNYQMTAAGQAGERANGRAKQRKPSDPQLGSRRLADLGAHFRRQ